MMFGPAPRRCLGLLNIHQAHQAITLSIRCNVPLLAMQLPQLSILITSPNRSTVQACILLTNRFINKQTCFHRVLIIIIIIRAFVRRTMLASELNLRRRNSCRAIRHTCNNSLTGPNYCGLNNYGRTLSDASVLYFAAVFLYFFLWPP